MGNELESQPLSYVPTQSPLVQGRALYGATALEQDLDPTNSGLPAIAPLLLDTPSPKLLTRLYETNPDYVSHMLWQLAAQLKNGDEVLRGYFSESDGIILNAGLIAQFCLLFQGFIATGATVTQEIGVPVFDIEIPENWVFDLTSSSTRGDKASFAIKIMGLSGGYGANKTVSGSVSVPKNKQSCQAQVWATIEWRRYERQTSGETLYVGNVTNVVDGMVVRYRDEPEYRTIYADRYAQHLKKIGASSGEKNGKFDYAIEKSASSDYSFEMPVSLGEFGVSTFTVTMSSTCQSKIALAADFPMAVYDIKGPTDNPVVISVLRSA
ncbi:hypothetical protein AAFN88_17755 [Pelagibius sp. CAU 1746]|uniref:hypothetical protein n=1 Tax=Pelagibius sp. CAU 1746 TaxID=3140370 RepID=UPI00325AEDAC